MPGVVPARFIRPGPRDVRGRSRNRATTRNVTHRVIDGSSCIVRSHHPFPA